MDSLGLLQGGTQLSAKYRKKADNIVKGILKRLKEHKISYKSALSELSTFTANNAFYKKNLWIYREKYKSIQQLLDEYDMVIKDIDYKRQQDLRFVRTELLESNQGNKVSKDAIYHELTNLINNVDYLDNRTWNLSDEIKGYHIHGIL